MEIGIFVEVWSKYGIQMLVLMSLVFQLLLFILPVVRRCHKILEKRVYPARLFKLLLWLAYQLADTTAIYVLGHMAISSSSSNSLSGEVMALWASLLLVHLGGQDTMTAYSLEDNRLWKRHLLTLLVQAAGVVYVLHGLGGAGGGRRSGPYPRLRTASALMFVVGFLKFAERIWVLRASDMNKLFTRQQGRGGGRVLFQFEYPAPLELDSSAELAEEDLKHAHELLYFCMCQFVGYHKYLHRYHESVIKCYARKKRLCELVHVQLSLMHDLLYTKAAAIHTWCGFLLRVFSWIATATTCRLVFLSGSSYGGRRLDAAVTYALLAGAFLLETASSLKAAGSTWTYETLRSKGWSSFNCVVDAFYRLVRAAECGPGRVAQAFRRLVRPAEWSRRRCPGYIGGQEETIMGVSWWSEYGQTDPNTSLFVDEIEKMVTAYCNKDKEEKEKLMNSRGGLSLDRLQLPSLKASLEKLEFDEYLVIWYYATCKFNDYQITHERIRRGVYQLSRYMMYLFKKKPHMLPPPVRQKTCPNLSRADREEDSVYQNLVNELLKPCDYIEEKRKLKAVLWVWIEMLCYAASHCDRESHARELSNGSPELATVLWVVRAALINVDFKLLSEKEKENANMKPAVSTVDAASVGDKSPVATGGNNVITHGPYAVPPVLDTDLIGNHRRVVSV